MLGFLALWGFCALMLGICYSLRHDMVYEYRSLLRRWRRQNRRKH
jgi:hypothetical protein